jgi:hypothetical protein
VSSNHPARVIRRAGALVRDRTVSTVAAAISTVRIATVATRRRRFTA